MAHSTTLRDATLAKLKEQVDVLVHLIELIPPGRLGFHPDAQQPLSASGVQADPFSELMSLSRLLGHILECLAGFCALLYKLSPEKLAHFQSLREKPVNHECLPDEACDRIADYLSHIEEGFAVLSDEDLSRTVPTVFVPAGEPVMTLLLGNLEHLMNHKHQLFIYLRLLGIKLGTPDLYKLRGA